MSIESYLDKPFYYKVRKVIRYIGLYGFLRTLRKIEAQLHMTNDKGFDGKVWINPKCKTPVSNKRSVGIIGAGNFAYTHIAYFLCGKAPNTIRGVMDIKPAYARSLATKYKSAYATVDVEEIINDPNIDLVYIASNHATHTPYAIMALEAGKDVHIEKPHAVTLAQLEELKQALEKFPERKVFLGFNRPRSSHFKKLKQAMAKESGASMINWFVAGHEISDDHWYFSEAEGGRILGNLCHWSDLTLELVGYENAFPCRIVPCSAKGAKSDFVTSIEFADGSTAAITFSAKGHTFEGVREVLHLHKGSLLAEIKDFKSLLLTRGISSKKHFSWIRDHGHEKNILNSYNNSRQGAEGSGCSLPYVVATAELFLGIREAHQSGCEVTVHIDK